MKFNFTAPIELRVYGSVDAESKEEAEEKICNDLRITAEMKNCEDDECDTEWDIHYACHGNVCNFFGGGIELDEE